MARQKKTKDSLDSSEAKEVKVEEKLEQKSDQKIEKQKEAKKPIRDEVKKVSSKQPQFTVKERLMFRGKECSLVEVIKDKVVVRFLDGTYSSGAKKEFTVL